MAAVGIDLHALAGDAAQRPAEFGVRFVVGAHATGVVALDAKDDGGPVALSVRPGQFLQVAAAAGGDRVGETAQAVEDERD